MLVSGAFLVLQVAAGSYGQGVSAAGSEVFWLVIGTAMLWLIYRRQDRVARTFVVFFSVFGAALYVIVALAQHDDPRYAVVAAAYIGQAWPLLTRTVRRHVRNGPQR